MTESTEHKPIKPASKTQNWLEFGSSAVVGVVSGAITAITSIRREFGEEVNTWPGMAPVHDEHGEVIDKGLTQTFSEKFDKIDHKYYGKPELWKEHAAEKTAAKNAYNDARNIKFLKGGYGIESEGFFKGTLYGSYQRYKHLGTSTKKLDIIAKSVSVVVIIGVGCYNLITGLATRKKARQIEDLLIETATKSDQAAAPALSAESPAPNEYGRRGPSHHIADAVTHSTIHEKAQGLSLEA